MGTWVAALFGGLADLIASYLAKKTIFATAVIGGFLALTTAFIVALGLLKASLYGALPPWVVGLGYLIPDNGSLCFSVCISARISKWIYEYHKEVLKTSVVA